MSCFVFGVLKAHLLPENGCIEGGNSLTMVNNLEIIIHGREL